MKERDPSVVWVRGRKTQQTVHKSCGNGTGLQLIVSGSVPISADFWCELQKAMTGVPEKLFFDSLEHFLLEMLMLTPVCLVWEDWILWGWSTRCSVCMLRFPWQALISAGAWPVTPKENCNHGLGECIREWSDLVSSQGRGYIQYFS